MAKKNKKNKRRRTDDYGNGHAHNGDSNGLDDVAGPDGIIPNGFTIDFGDDFDGPARPKKNRDDSDDDEEDSTQQAPRGGHGSQVLPFASKLPDDHSGEPLDGHEYLFLVRREAAAHPSIKTAEAFIRRIDEEIVVEIASTSAIAPHRPSTEWRTSFLSRFSNMRQVIASSSTQPGPSDVPPHYLPIPAAQDESSWRTYINGRKGKGRATQDEEPIADAGPLESVAAPSDVAAAPQIAPDIEGGQAPNGTALEASSTAEGSSAAASKVARTEPRPPIPILMRALEHYTIISLLEHFQIWLSDRLENVSNATKPSTIFIPNSMARKKKKPLTSTANPASDQASPLPPAAREPVVPTTPLILTPLDSQWMFSLLTVLDPLLSSGEISVLRSLARTCHEIADFTWTEQQKWLGKGAASGELNKYTESIGGCWMITAAIWEIWGQRDLWE